VHNANILDGASKVRFFGCFFFTTVSDATLRHLSVDGGGVVSGDCTATGCSFAGQNNTTSVVGIFGNACEDFSIDGCFIDCTGSDAYALTASAAGTRIVNCAKLFGAKIDASAGTTQILPDGGFVFLDRSATFTGPTVFDFGGGYSTFTVGNSVNAFRFRLLGAGVNEVFELGGWRLWVDSATGNLRIKGTDPVSTTDGNSLGPGVFVGTFATLPVAAPIGTMVRCTDLGAASLPWSTVVVAGGGVFSAFLIWNGVNWTTIGA
jgi:hypothetical protein